MEQKLTLEVYSKDDCVQCDATTRLLGKNGLIAGEDYQKINVEENPDALEFLIESGYKQVPVGILRNTPEKDGEAGEVRLAWAGFRSDRIKEAARLLLQGAGISSPVATPPRAR